MTEELPPNVFRIKFLSILEAIPFGKLLRRFSGIVIYD